MTLLGIMEPLFENVVTLPINNFAEVIMGYIYVSGDDIDSAEASYVCGTSDLPDRINGVPMSAIVGPGHVYCG